MIQNYINHIALVVDRSGSMSVVQSEVASVNRKLVEGTYLLVRR
jgi:hypothetical protein